MTELPYCDLEIQRCAPAHRIGIIWGVGVGAGSRDGSSVAAQSSSKRGTTMPYDVRLTYKAISLARF